MENVQTCLNFLEYYNVSVNDITAEGKKNSSFLIFQNPLSIWSFYFSGLGICEFTFGNWKLCHHLRVSESKKNYVLHGPKCTRERNYGWWSLNFHLQFLPEFLPRFSLPILIPIPCQGISFEQTHLVFPTLRRKSSQIKSLDIYYTIFLIQVFVLFQTLSKEILRLF